MKAEMLRKSILQYAIQGKLVPQIDTEEPVSELLKKIKNEKQELTKQGKIKEEKALPYITEEEKPFDIPDSWEWVRFSDCSILYTGDSINAQEKKKKYSNLNEGYNYIATKDVGFDASIDYNNGIIIPFDTNFKIAKSNSILLCIEGGSAGRKIGLLSEDVCFGNKLCCFESLQINYMYLFYYLQTPTFTENFKKNKSGMIGGVGVNTLKTLYFALPPLDEQLRIVARIKELMILVDEYGKKEVELEKLEKEFPEKLKKSILQYAMQGKLVPQIDTEEPARELLKKIRTEKEELIRLGKIKKSNSLPPIADDEKPFDIPDSWEWVKLCECFSIIRGSSPRPKGSPLYWSKERTELHWITIKDITSNTQEGILIDTNEYLTPKGAEYSTFVKSRELIIAVSGSTAGKHCLTGIDGYIYDGLAAVINDTQQVNPYFLNLYFDWVYEMLNGQKAGSAFPNINTDILKKSLFPLPPKEEQQRIVARIEKLFALVDMASNGGKMKVRAVEIPLQISPPIIEFMPKQEMNKRVDIASFGLAAREDGEVEQADLDVALSEVQDFYDKSEN